MTPLPREHPSYNVFRRIAARDSRYLAYLQPEDRGGPGPAAPAAKPAAGPCVHLGDALTGPEREAAGLPHAKRWSLCLADPKPLGEYVCPCKGCGPRCPGYEAEADA